MCTQNQLNLLIADQHSKELEKIVASLKTQGHNIIITTSGEQALRFQAAAHFDALLINFELYDRTGGSIIKQINAVSAFLHRKNPKFFMISNGTPSSEKMKLAQEYRCSAVFSKPYDYKKAFQKIENECC